jgi:hypothetical protein
LLGLNAVAYFAPLPVRKKKNSFTTFTPGGHGIKTFFFVTDASD